MNSFKLNFGHPVKGTLRITGAGKDTGLRTVPFDTKDSNLLELSLDEIGEGTWYFTVEWEYDGKEYLYQAFYPTETSQ